MRGEASHILEGCQKHTNKMYKIRVKKTEQSGCQASFIWPLYPAESHADSIRTLFLCLWNCESIVSSTWTDVNRTSHNVKFGLKLCTMARTARKEALEAKLQQILKLKEEVKAEISADSESEGNVSAVSAPRATGLSDKCIVTFADGREIKVIIGTSEHIQEPLVDQICRIVDEAYSKVGKHKRVDRYDAVDRCLAFFKKICLCLFAVCFVFSYLLNLLIMSYQLLPWGGLDFLGLVINCIKVIPSACWPIYIFQEELVSMSCFVRVFFHSSATLWVSRQVFGSVWELKPCWFCMPRFGNGWCWSTGKSCSAPCLQGRWVGWLRQLHLQSWLDTGGMWPLGTSCSWPVSPEFWRCYCSRHRSRATLGHHLWRHPDWISVHRGRFLLSKARTCQWYSLIVS